MEMTNKTIHAKRRVRIMIMGSVALLVAALCTPFFTAHAAGCSKSKGNTISSSMTNNSVTSDFSSATLVCVSRSTAVSTLGSSAWESGSSKHFSKKATICHIPPGNPGNPQTLSVGQSSVQAHLDHGDSMGSCEAVSAISTLSSCTTFDGGSTVTGVWLPDSVVGNGDSMTAYIAQLQSGVLSGKPDSTSQSYREISGQ